MPDMELDGLASSSYEFVTVFGAAGYIGFGNATEAPITLNMASNWSTMFVKLALCLGLYLTFPIMMFPSKCLILGIQPILSRILFAQANLYSLEHFRRMESQTASWLHPGTCMFPILGCFDVSNNCLFISTFWNVLGAGRIFNLHNAGIYFSLLLSSEGSWFGVIVVAIFSRSPDTRRRSPFRNKGDVWIGDCRDEWRGRGGTLDDTTPSYPVAQYQRNLRPMDQLSDRLWMRLEKFISLE